MQHGKESRAGEYLAKAMFGADIVILLLMVYGAWRVVKFLWFLIF